ncbi:aspartate-semialdehyde dehydrogenase [Streptomyces sp. CAU 1734]|uniref:aspartate-semialdehyde dehydrogenase n=1 Tax=Streptomyces sp. CAU 1734 TaxID=3140360 RepID=UPI003260FA32
MTLTTDPAAPRVALVGATGVIGTTLIRLIEERRFRHRALHLLASDRSAGRELTVEGRPHPVRDLADFDFSRVDIAFFAAGDDISRKYVPTATAAGALVIDSTSAFRMDPATPLVVPQVNAHVLGRRPASGIVAAPASPTVPLVRLLGTVERRWGIRQVVVSTYQAASDRGHSGTAELYAAGSATLADPDDLGPAQEFTPSLAFNVIPFIGTPLDSGFTSEEQRMRQETRKILSLPHLDVTATCVRVPVAHGHSETAWIECAAPVERDELIERLTELPEVTVHDRIAPNAFPTPRTVTSRPDHVHVGRIRVSETNPRGFWLWVVADNTRVGGALNALQIAEAMTLRGTL